MMREDTIFVKVAPLYKVHEEKPISADELDGRNKVAVIIPKDFEFGKEILKSKVCHILAIDRSGSMGSAFDMAIQGAIEQIEELYINDENADVTLILYESTTSIYRFKNASDFLKEKDGLLLLSDTGMTDFCIVFDQIQREISDRIALYGSVDFKVYFMTDGCDTINRKERLAASLQNFKNMINSDLWKTVGSVVVHSIGFTESHNLEMLNEICHCSEAGGVFEYARDRLELERIFKSLELNSSQSIKIIINTGEKEHIVNLVKSDEEYVTKCIVGNIKELSINVGGKKCDADISYLELNKDNLKKMIGINAISFVEIYVDEVVNISSQLVEKSSDVDVVNTLKDKINFIDNQLDILIKQGYRTTTEMRKEVIGKVLELKNTVSAIIRTITDLLTNRLSTYDIKGRLATLLSTAHQVKKKGMQKRLDKRVLKNSKFLVELDSKIDNVMKSIDLTSIDEIDDKFAKQTCFLSLCDFRDAIKDKDVLCIGLNVIRPESAVVDPSRIKFKFCKSHITLNTFMDTYNMALNGGKMNFGEDKFIVKGLAGENISGAFPLYKCYDHYKLARHLMKPLFGVMATSNPAGFSMEQLYVIPMSLLSHLAVSLFRDVRSEFNLYNFYNVLRVAYQLDKENHFVNPKKDEVIDEKFKSVHKLVLSYADSPLNRISSEIKHNYIFLMSLALLEEKIDLKTIIFYMIHEEVRRIIKREFSDPDERHELLLDLLNARPYVKTSEVDKTSSEEYRNIAINKIGKDFKYGISHDSGEEKPKKLYVAPTGSEGYHTNKRYQRLVHKIKKHLQFLKCVVKAVQFVDKVTLSVIVSELDKNYGELSPLLINLGKTTELEDILTEEMIDGILPGAIIQGIYFANNFKIKYKKYILQDSIEHRNEAICMVANSVIKSEEEKLAKASLDTTDETAAELFSNTADLLTAVGICVKHLTHSAVNAFHKFIHAMVRKHNSPLLKEKMQMMMNGGYKFVDSDGKVVKEFNFYDPHASHKWDPKSNTIRKIYLKNKKQLTFKQWQKLFPRSRKNIYIWYRYVDKDMPPKGKEEEK